MKDKKSKKKIKRYEINDKKYYEDGIRLYK